MASGPITSAGVPGGCLDDYQNATVGPAAVDVYPCNGGQAQNFTLMSDGTIQVNGLCLSAAEPGNGTIYSPLAACGNAALQRWAISNGQIAIQPASLNFCLDDPTAVSYVIPIPGLPSFLNGLLVLSKCTSATTQRWGVPQA